MKSSSRSRLGALITCAWCISTTWRACAQDASQTPSLATGDSPVSLRPISDDDRVTLASASTTGSAPAASAPPDLADSAPASAPASTSASDSAPVAPLPNTPEPAPSAAPAAAGTPDVPPVSVAANTSDSSKPAVAEASTASSSPSQNVTINLINLMVKRNLISADDAASLIKQAEQEADLARAQAVTTQATADRALTIQSSMPPPAPAPVTTPSDDEVRVAYVPDVVKKQITDQVTQNVMEQTREEHLADTVAASQVPDWVKRFHVTGDIRLRFEDQSYPAGNAVGTFTNFNAINTSASGFNVNSFASQVPQYDVDQDRDRFRLRARIGAEIDLGENFVSGLRIATGSDDNPVTENQTLGAANNGQGGNFGKYQIWLDRAFIRYELGATPDRDFTATIGRFDNPFFHTSMIWADDLAFDGVVLQGRYKVATGVTPFLTAGAFPVFNTDLNFSTDQSTKFASEDKYLFAVQGGTSWNINKDFSVKAAGAIYDFEDIQGKVSDPILNAGQNAGNTDDSRPSFAQNGNTYIALRDYEDPTAAPGVTTENQFYGLATRFQVAAVTGRIDFAHFDPFHMSLTGEFIKNVAFDRNDIINNGPGSNPGPQNNTLNSDPNSFVGGDMGYLVHLDLGKAALEQLWDWNVQLSYRYVQSDATVDGFTDSDFGGNLTGTNLKGYTIGGNLALSQRVWMGLRYMSADAVAGPTFRNDLVQFDLNAKF
jgi:Putative porin